MGEITTRMGLAAWNQLSDRYDYQQLANNFNIIDFHDHTPGRGVPIPAGGIAPGAVGLTQLDPAVPIIATGAMMLWGTNTAPAGYLLCDGTAYQQSVYPALFAVIGSIYNNSPPGGYFNVPVVTLDVPAYGQLHWIIKV